MCDLIVTHARELLTLAGAGPRRGRQMADVGIIGDGAVAVGGERIIACGPTRDLLDRAGPATKIIDASGCVVMPGFVDAHTHLVFAGDRAAEFEQRLQGATYLEILAHGGGILSTVRATRQASAADLAAQAAKRLAVMLAYGTTTAEAKTGYGLDLASEMKMLAIAVMLNKTQPVHIIPTFMAAHAVPPEFSGRADEYVDAIVHDMLPVIAPHPSPLPDGAREHAAPSPCKGEGWGEGGSPAVTPHPNPLPDGESEQTALFCDVFCDQGAFTVEQSRRVLRAAKAHGLGLKIHADEFVSLGGARLAAELGAVSAEHLAVTPREDMEAMAAAGVIAVLLPGTTFGLGSSHYADGRAMIASGLAVALGTDLNPGTCYCESMPLMIALACRYLKLSPAEAICAATINAAYASGLGDRLGSLEAGKLADIIILSVPDHRHLAYRFGGNPVARVIKSGREVTHGLS